MSQIATTKMELLCRVLQGKRSFLFKVPKHTVYYRPAYHWPLGLQEGNIILFASDSLALNCVFLGEIKAVNNVGRQGWPQLAYFDVDCISRPDGRGANSLVNGLNKVKIFEKSIICLLQASRLIHGYQDTTRRGNSNYRGW